MDSVNYELRYVRQAELCTRVMERLHARGHTAVQIAPSAGMHYYLSSDAPLAVVCEAAREVALIIQVVVLPEGGHV